jgi:hypothetical protein
VLGPEAAQGLTEQRVVVGGEVVELGQAACAGVVRRRVGGVLVHDEDRRGASCRKNPRNHQAASRRSGQEESSPAMEACGDRDLAASCYCTRQ